MSGRPVHAAATLLAAALLLLTARPALACAGCSNPNLPGGRGGSQTVKPGEVSVSMSLSGTSMRVVHAEACPDIGPICSVRDEPPQLHDQRFWVGELRPIVEWGLTPTWGLEVQLPVRLTRTDVVFRRLSGEAFAPDYENIHHRNETLYGLSDPWLSGRGAWRLGDVHLTAKAGITLPLGRTEVNPFELGRQGLPHQHIQFGTGVVAPVLQVDAAYALSRSFTLTGYVQALVVPFENSKSYQAGHRFAGSAALDMALVGTLRASLGADVLNEQPERWNGRIEQDGNVGRTDLLVGGSLRYSFSGLTAQLSVKAPVWQHFIEAGHAHGGDPGQLTYPAIASFSLQRTFGGGTP